MTEWLNLAGFKTAAKWNTHVDRGQKRNTNRTCLPLFAMIIEIEQAVTV